MKPRLTILEKWVCFPQLCYRDNPQTDQIHHDVIWRFWKGAPPFGSQQGDKAQFANNNLYGLEHQLTPFRSQQANCSSITHLRKWGRIIAEVDMASKSNVILTLGKECNPEYIGGTFEILKNPCRLQNSAPLGVELRLPGYRIFCWKAIQSWKYECVLCKCPIHLRIEI